MDAHTLELLEFDRVRALLADYSSTSLGRELARQIEPGRKLLDIRAAIDITSEMSDALGAGQSPPFGGIHDVRILVRRAAIGTMLLADELLQVADTLTATGAIYRYRMRLEGRFGRIIELLIPVEDMGSIAKAITNCIDGRAHIVDHASPDLMEIRGKLDRLDERVQVEVKRLLRDPELRKVLRFPNATVNGDHYVLPVPVNYRARVPGVVHRTSSTGETLFVEPEAIARLSAERVILKGEEEREEKRILRKLSAEVGKVAVQVVRALDIVAKLDLIAAKARFARDFEMYAPDLNDQGRLWLRNARHPILEHIFRQPIPNSEIVPGHEPTKKREVVPIEMKLGVGFNILVITGPNTGGKTVTLKTTGLLCVMAMCGMHIPAAQGSMVPVFDHILADIGDEQSLEQSLSTFSSHITRIAEIFRQANANSLILLDELGAGTDPTEGAALGRAILDEIDQSGARAIVTTHLGDLKTYAFSNERAENGAVEFSLETLSPTYRLHIGQFGMSNALKIAKKLKLPKELLNRAYHYLQTRKGKTPELGRLQELREEAEKARTDALAKMHEAELQKLEYEKRLAELEKRTLEDAALKSRREKLQPKDKVHVPRFDKVGTVVRVDLRKGLVMVSVGMGQWEFPLDQITPVDG